MRTALSDLFFILPLLLLVAMAFRLITLAANDYKSRVDTQTQVRIAPFTEAEFEKAKKELLPA